MEQLHNGFTLELSPGGFPLSTDSVVLAGFVRPGPKAKILDLGSGCGTLGLLLCAEDPGCHVTGIELDADAHAAALENIRRNNLQDRMDSICGDLRAVCERFSPGSFTACISNPPYFSGGPAGSRTTARREDHCTLEDLFRSAARSVKYGGDFFLVHRPERLAEIFACASSCNMETKRLCLVRHKPEAPVNLVLIQFRKGGKPGLLWEDLILHNSDGSPTEAYRKLYHL